MSPIDWIGGYVVVAVLATIFELALTIDPNSSDDAEVEFVTVPRRIYNSTRLNWFACWLFYILLRVLSPIISLIMFVWWVLHVGRKD